MIVGMGVLLLLRGYVGITQTAPDTHALLSHQGQRELLDGLLVLQQKMAVFQHTADEKAPASQTTAVPVPYAAAGFVGAEADQLLLTLRGTAERIRAALTAISKPPLWKATPAPKPPQTTTPFVPIFPRLSFTALAASVNMSLLDDSRTGMVDGRSMVPALMGIVTASAAWGSGQPALGKTHPVITICTPRGKKKRCGKGHSILHALSILRCSISSVIIPAFSQVKN